MTDFARYSAAAHAMQAGVAMEMHHNAAPTERKHLRVGINTALTDAAGLVKLLIAKGVFTEEEYLASITESMEAEKSRYEKYLTELIGVKISLV